MKEEDYNDLPAELVYCGDGVGHFKLTDEISYSEASCAYDESTFQQYVHVTVGGRKYEYVSFGADNHLPYDTMKHIHKSSVLSMNKLFNVMTCYGQGMQYKAIETEGQPNPAAQENVSAVLKEVRKFMFRNNMAKFFMEQITDMKHFFYAVAVIILNREDEPKIVKIVHKEACYCRFERAGKKGYPEHVFYGNFRDADSPNNIEVIPVLDDYDPVGDLEQKLKRLPRNAERKFAVVTKFPTIGNQYYPIPYYTAIFRDGWYDISQLISIGKKAKLKNKASIPYLVEIHRDYWTNRFRQYNINTEKDKKEEVAKVKREIEDCLTGVSNTGKMFQTGYYTTPDGKEVHYVKITKIDTAKEGGEYSADIAESNNVMCYADGLHPNLVGATPGTSQTNNSGSDKRELFTMKQAIEKPFHDILARLHWIVIYWNKWDEAVEPDVPMIMLTTLDEKKDAKKVTVGEESKSEK